MIIDIHTHTFPLLGSQCGDDPPDVQLKFLQHHLFFHHQGWFHDTSKKTLNTPLLYDDALPGISGMRNVEFRVGEYGRMTFTVEGEEFWLQWLPPTFRQLECPPELVITNMDYVGVDLAVLCPTHLYGELNLYTSNCVHTYPDRFIGIASIREWKAYQPEEIERLTFAIEELGLNGLHFASEAFFMVDFEEDWNSSKFDGLWQEVKRLNIPIFWDIFSWGNDPWGQWEIEVNRLLDWARCHPEIPSLITHGLPILRWDFSPTSVNIPDIVWELYQCPNMFIEVMLPGQLGKDFDYPYPIAHKVLKQLVEELGPHKLIWGSDIPTIERTITYRQSLSYLSYCDFLSDKEFELLTSGNAMRLINL